MPGWTLRAMGPMSEGFSGRIQNVRKGCVFGGVVIFSLRTWGPCWDAPKNLQGGKQACLLFSVQDQHMLGAEFSAQGAHLFLGLQVSMVIPLAD